MRTHRFDARRRRLLLAGAAAAVSPIAFAQGGFPSQPLKIIVPFGPGGLADVTTRLTAQKLGEKLNQQVIIDNRPGAGGIVAAQTALTAPKDGHTLILFSNGTTIAKTLLKLPYDPQADFVPVSSLAYFDLNLLVGKDSKFTDLKSLLAEGARRPLTFGTINPGSTQHLSAELFKAVSKLNATLVPFKTSGEVQAGIQRGDIDVGFESYTALRGAIDGGVLRAIAGTGPTRTTWLPNVPTAKESGVDYEVTGWNALYAPKGVPDAALEVLGNAMREVMAQPDLRKRLSEMGADPRASTAAEMGAVFERDRRKWQQVIQQANIKV
jgi:tripartite-type tricarboxylate transporter receptor subunit TctC